MNNGLSSMRYGLLMVAVFAQWVTLWITWPLWEVRTFPVHMPLIDLPQLPFGLLLVSTLVFMLYRPQAGLVCHVGVLLVSFVFDQYRTQPQFIALAVLMFAVVSDHGVTVVRWFLASLWLWAGLHKLISPDWFGDTSYYFVYCLYLDPDQWQMAFCYGVGLGEVAVGVLAIVRPRWAAVPCVMMHLGICGFLSPLFLGHNVSVMPWNLATAVIGAWVMLSARATVPASRLEWRIAAVLLLYPAGFYAGLVDHGIAHVLYSENYPQGLVTNEQGAKKIVGWEMRVPFPNERRLLTSYFQRSGKPGDKMHLADPRPWLDDRFLVIGSDGELLEVSREEFQSEPMAGRLLED